MTRTVAEQQPLFPSLAEHTDHPDPSVRTGRPPADPALEAAIASLIARRGGSDDVDLLHDMVRNVLGLIDDGTRRGDLKIVNSALADLRAAFRVFGRYDGVRKVSIFGSARTPPDHPDYQQALAFSARIASHGYMVITGGGGGVMLAANQGASRDRSFGLLIKLPFEPAANDVIDQDEKLITFKHFFTRKLSFIKEADAVVLLPGGFGTLDECFEALTLIQTGKTAPVPVVFLDSPGSDYWSSMREHIDQHLLEHGRIDADDPALYLLTDDADHAVSEITGFYRNYHSLRYVGEWTVLRHLAAVDDRTLGALNDEFGDLVKSGRIERSGPLPGERDEPRTGHLQRLILRFDRRRFGRLRELIRRLNQSVPVGEPALG